MTRHGSPASRRSFVALGTACIGAPSLALWSRVAGAATRRLTPAQTEGPFYPLTIPADSDADLLANGALRYGRGQPAWVEGTLADADGRALRGATIEIWQCDEQGHYHHPGDGDRADRAFQGFGRAMVDADGRWRFRTIRPVAYGGRAPHIHAKVKLGAREVLTTQLYVEGDPGNDRDFLWRRLAAEDRPLITRPFVPSGDGMKASFALVVAA
ncbi:MAG: protocatechuate 3,4-dioxygenase [Aquincola sp.]|nr:protocatechuate 3,4-dioxygenase [Aquincola sp.]MDH4289891.1 protocatechuate 3,4-dioxygenase [Aquincola sp.]MDH5329703.1 protocatechuate 3,4-dioxygenase [Aquincola sp.]